MRSVNERDLNMEYLAEGKGAIATARFGDHRSPLCNSKRASKGAGKVFQKICKKPI